MFEEIFQSIQDLCLEVLNSYSDHFASKELQVWLYLILTNFAFACIAYSTCFRSSPPIHQVHIPALPKGRNIC